nr:hypothetical protein [Acinetobacter baumannii]
MSKIVSILLFFIASSALAAEKCDYKVQFDDTIPANVSFIKLGKAKSYTKFEVKPDYF